MIKSFWIWIVFGAVVCSGFGAEKTDLISFISYDGGNLAYGADTLGNRVPDFSHCGYLGGDQAIPDVPVRIVVEPTEGDNTARIQAAIDYLASLEAGSDGVRGAILLRRGVYQIYGGLKISVSGVVLRGEGMGDDGTVLVASGKDRRALIRIAGKGMREWGTNAERKIIDEYVPVGAYGFRIDNTEGFKAGDRVCVIRPCTQEWIDILGMDAFGGGLRGYFAWKPGSRVIVWDRVIRSIEGDRVTVDAPITTAIEKTLGSATVQCYQWPGRIEKVGVEHLRCRSAYDPANPKDEDHAWMAVTFENVENAWVRQVTTAHFAGSAVAIYESGSRITVEDCISLAPVSEIGGYRRHTFFTMGQQTLFLRCWSEQGRHDFSTGYCAAGPNAFVQCESSGSLDDSGPIESWASGVLYDNVRIDGNALRLCNRGSRGEGIGWAAANSVLWQCQAAIIECDKPQGIWNWAFGCWAEFEGRGYWYESNSFIRPHSLYAAQLQQRLGAKAPAIPLIEESGSSTTSPSVELAAEMTARSEKTAESLRDYIQNAPKRNLIPTDITHAKKLEEIYTKKPEKEMHTSGKKMTLSNGRLVCDNQLVIGGTTGVAWWRGNIRPDKAPTFGLGVTRFVPGRIGLGYTDDLDELTDMMISNGQTILEHNYGLWYDRRRDDHQHIRRMNGDVRPPFYEQPFARSGTGTAWDGLSRYDLTKYNLWYWSRLKHFADLCDRKGLVLIHQNYFQHNILEAAAHWADCPWRPANNINNTGFPEPPFLAGGKRVFLDEPFYDITDPIRRPLHKAYIRQCMENFADNSNVIQSTSEEYTGPLEFVQFWLDTIIEWQQETGRTPLIGLSCTKDVQDQILSDPQRSSGVSIIDMRYWWYQGSGQLYAPKGGQHLAPRQHIRQMRPRGTSFSQVVRALRDYRSQYPDKAVLYSADHNFGWAVLMGGGSIPRLPSTTDKDLLHAVVPMEPFELQDNKGCYALAEPGRSYLIYVDSGNMLSLDLSHTTGEFEVYTVDLRTGKCTSRGEVVQAKAGMTLNTADTPCLIWLKRK